MEKCCSDSAFPIPIPTYPCSLCIIITLCPSLGGVLLHAPTPLVAVVTGVEEHA